MTGSEIKQKAILVLVISCAVVSMLLAGIAVKPASGMNPGYILPSLPAGTINFIVSHAAEYSISLDDDLVPTQTSGVDSRSFLTWLFNPMQGSMLIFIVIFMAGILVGAGLVFLEYHNFKISFEQLGKILIILFPLIAIGAIVVTLAMHKYNFFLLSLYIDIPLIVAPVVYVVYKKFLAPKIGRGKL
jgi:hypothetical protein